MAFIDRPPAEQCQPCRHRGRPVFEMLDGRWIHRHYWTVDGPGGVPMDLGMQWIDGNLGCRSHSWIYGEGWDEGLKKSWYARP